MALDQEDRERICCDLADLCRYETDEVWSGSRVKADIKWCGDTTTTAEVARYSAEKRLRLLSSLGVKSQRWQEQYVEIRKCIQRLDEFIERKPFDDWLDPEVEG